MKTETYNIIEVMFLYVLAVESVSWLLTFIFSDLCLPVKHMIYEKCFI